MSPPMVGNAGSGARRKTALIVEGGAMRGAWAAGVLAYLQECGRRQYDLVYAASSGACSAVYFVADMWEPGLAIWRELASKVVRKTNFLRRKPIIDLAYLVDHIIRKRVPLSVEALQKAPTRFYIVLTDCHTGEPVYFHVCDDRVFAALRATSSMPWRRADLIMWMATPTLTAGWRTPFPSAVRYRMARRTSPWCSRTIPVSASRRYRAGWENWPTRNGPWWPGSGPRGKM